MTRQFTEAIKKDTTEAITFELLFYKDLYLSTDYLNIILDKTNGNCTVKWIQLYKWEYFIT